MITGRQYLRAHQGDHSLILLNSSEFAALNTTGSAPLPARHNEHFSRVLRRAASWNAIVGDGKGHLSEAVVERGEIRLKHDGKNFDGGAPQRRVGIAQAWIKPKALALVLQKSAELGVDDIVLFDSEYSAPHGEKPQRIDAILENACMQAYNPVKPSMRFAGSVQELRNAQIRAFFGNPNATDWLSPVSAGGQDCLFVCGPEGGFSDAEAAYLADFADGVLISENVLRAETAAIIAAGILCLGK